MAGLLTPVYFLWYSNICYGVAMSGSSSVVEHRLAKARVAGSNPVFRSIFYRRHSQEVRQGSAKPLSPVRIWVPPPFYRESGGTGRRYGLKIRWLKGRGGSSPPFPTTVTTRV